MSSNAYIASDGEKLMKVGKANNPKRREKQIDLTITLTVACLDEVSAYRIEDQLRQFIIERGGIKHPRTVDWFAFDPQIYRMVCEFAANLDGFTALSEEESQEAEIALLRKRYFQLLADESNLDTPENRLRAENEKLKQEISFMQKRYEDRVKELDAVHQKHGNLIREFGRWEGTLTWLKGKLKKQNGNPIDPQEVLDVLNGLISDSEED